MIFLFQNADIKFRRESYSWTSLAARTVINLPATWQTRVQSLDREDLLEKGMATHSSIPAWTIPFLAPAHAFKCLASQVVPMVKNPPASPGDKRCGFSLWVGTIPWRRKQQPMKNYIKRGGAWQAPWGYKRVMATFFVFNFFMENFKHIQK